MLASVRGTGLSVLALTAGLLGLWAIALAGSASAALPSNCSQSGQTVTCTFSYTGAEQTWSVPAGVASAQINAVGGTGGVNEDNDGFGGYGGTVSANVAVTGGSTLYVDVGGNGATGTNGGAGGLSGSQASGGTGGDQSGNGGGGGGASVVQTCSANSSNCTASYYTASEPRLVVAGGGGGAGGFDGCNGGNGGGGVNPTSDYVDCTYGGGGGNGTGGTGQWLNCESSTFNGGGGGATPSAAGAGGNSDTGQPGSSGSGSTGGNGYTGGTASNGFGGGGGGGYYGGGGGGATDNCDEYGFGAGAGSSFANGTNVTYGNDATATPSVTIAYTIAKTSTSLSAPTSGTGGTTIPASSISSTLAGATKDATGTITFTVFGPLSSAPTNCATGGTTVGTATVSGNGTYNPSATFKPTHLGHYYWYASYSGDGGNQGSNSGCGSAMKSTVVKRIALSRLRISPHTLSTAGGKQIKATVKYTLNGPRLVTFIVKVKSHGHWVRVHGKFVKSLRKGAHHFVWRGKIGGHTLGPGTYKLIATPRKGASRSVKFTIVG